MKIIPAILVKSEAEFLQQTQAIEGATDIVHVDIADGEFVPETTWANPESVSANLKTDCELHLMVKNPLAIIKQWENVPQVTRVLFHVESGTDIDVVIKAIQAGGWEAVAVLNPETPSKAIESSANDLDGVMAMTIHPGAQGRPFMPEVLTKLTELKNQYPHLVTHVDGGVNANTIKAVRDAGIDCACVGSAIFGHDDPTENLKNLHKLIA